MHRTFYELYYHLIWTTYRRIPLTDITARKSIEEYILKKSVRVGIRTLVINFTPNHLHMLVSIPPRQCIATVVHDLKGSSSYYATHELALRDFSWQGGYNIHSRPESALPNLINYIKNQAEHHKYIE